MTAPVRKGDDFGLPLQEAAPAIAASSDAYRLAVQGSHNVNESLDWRCWLPFPPSTNNLFTQGVVKGKVRRFPSRQYKAWREEAVIRIRAAWRSKPPYAVPVVVKIELTPRDSRARDADNYAKPILDALVASRVLADDSNRWVKAVVPYWENPAATFGAIVMIRPAKDVRKPALNADERALLARIEAQALACIPPGWKPPAALWGLLEKGYVAPVPGLIEGVPQGYLAVA